MGGGLICLMPGNIRPKSTTAGMDSGQVEGGERLASESGGWRREIPGGFAEEVSFALGCKNGEDLKIGNTQAEEAVVKWHMAGGSVDGPTFSESHLAVYSQSLKVIYVSMTYARNLF